MMRRASPIAALLIAVLAYLGAAEAEAPAGLSEDQQDFWQQFQGEASVAAEAVRAEAEGWYLRARSLLQKAHFVEARDAIEQSVRINPAHPEAQQLRQEILGILSHRGDRLQMVANWLSAIRDVAVQEQAVEMARQLARGDAAFQAAEYRDAFLAYDRVSIALRSFPYRFDWGELPNEVEAKKLQAQARAREAAIAQDRAARDRAAIESTRRAEREEQALRNKVDEILRRARISFARNDFKRAEIDAWNAYQMDRRREDARSLYLEARRRSHLQFDAHYREERKERLIRVNEQIHKDLIPQDELLVFPEDWFRRSLREADTLQERSEEPWRQALRNQLEQEVTFIFEDNSLEEVIDFLRRTTGVNMVIGREVFADPSIPPITLAGTMRLRTVMNWIQEITRLRMTMRSEALYLSSEEVQGDVEVRLYTISDLISPVTDFPAMELAFQGGGQDAAGFNIFGGMGGGGFDDDGSLTVDDVEDFIRTSVRPETWMNPGVAIDIRAGGSTMFISHTPEVHVQIQALLDRLRSQQSLQVNVQIRVLDLTKSFLEEIGVEWNDGTRSLIQNPLRPEGFVRTEPTWSVTGTTANRLPGNSMQSGFGNLFGQGLRVEGMISESTSIIGLRELNFILEAVHQESDAQILNAPQITCFNGQRANATFIRQYAYIENYEVSSEGNYDPQIGIINFGDIIDVQPYVSADRKYVTLEVRPTSVIMQDIFVERIVAQRLFGSAAGGGRVVFTDSYPLELPNLEVRTMRSTVRLPDKGSLLLGGFTRGLRERAHSGIPFLSHIPFLGRLFSKNGIYDETRHLMFMVTTEIIDLAEREVLQ